MAVFGTFILGGFEKMGSLLFLAKSQEKLKGCVLMLWFLDLKKIGLVFDLVLWCLDWQ